MTKAEALSDLKQRKIWFFDRDGTLSLSNVIIPGAERLLGLLTKREIPFYVLTNNSSKSPAEHHETLLKIGFDLAPEIVLVSIEPALSHLEGLGTSRIHCLANREVAAYVEARGFTLDAEAPQALLLTYDTELTYEKIETFTCHLRAGVPYFATHTDIVCPTPRGGMPDAGTFIEMFRMATGRVPEMSFGKPETAFLAGVLEERGLTLADAVMVGDRLYTDIAMGSGNDLFTVLVLTGETSSKDYKASDTRADFLTLDLDHLAELLR